MVDHIVQKTPYYVRQAHFTDDRMAGSVPHWTASAPKIPPSDTVQALTNQSPGNSAITAPSLSFSELLDIINPLHHLPVVGNFYRNMTGDDLSPVARVAGGTLYGGALGGLSSLAFAAIEEHSGQNTAQAVQIAASSHADYYNFDDDPRTAGTTRIL